MPPPSTALIISAAGALASASASLLLGCGMLVLARNATDAARPVSPVSPGLRLRMQLLEVPERFHELVIFEQEACRHTHTQIHASMPFKMQVHERAE